MKLRSVGEVRDMLETAICESHDSGDQEERRFLVNALAILDEVTNAVTKKGTKKGKPPYPK